MKKIFFIFALTVLITGLSSAQNFQKASEWCSWKKRNNPDPLPDLTLMSPGAPRHSYDVLNYKLDLDIWACFKTPYPKSFKASNLITFRVDSTLNNINLNAVNTSLVIDSVRLVGGGLLNKTHTGNILNIVLDRTYNPGEIVNLLIHYRHNDVADQAFYVYNGVVFTDCEPEGARKWFPCWDRPSDKATVDIRVKTPSNVKLGSNGRLADSVATGDTIYYRWISRDPVATYLTVLTGKVNYGLDIVWWQKISNPNDSIQLRLYYNSGENYSNIKSILPTMTTYYSQKFGEHPFEKNGFATIPSGAGFTWGGMENQTLTSLCANCWNESYVSHEYAHQWFGDMITCATWADIFLNEGFATFIEAVWLERTGGYSAYKSDMLSNASSYLSSNPGWAISVPDWAVNTPNTNTLFNYAVTYCKGACVLHLLRYTLGDSLFFAGIKSYATDTVNFKHKSAVIPDFKDRMAQVSGQNLDWFFNAWIYQPNHPQYTNGYNIVNVGSNQWRVNFLAKQSQAGGFFPIPIMIKFSFSSGSDTTVRVMNNVNNELFSFYFNRQPTGVVFDPNNEIVIKTASLVVGIDENTVLKPEKYQIYQNYPNPFNPVTNIDYDLPVNSNVNISVYDMTGRQIEVLVNDFKQAGKHSVSYNAMNISSGIYYYKIQAGDFVSVKRMVLVK